MNHTALNAPPLEKLEDCIGYRFKNASLLAEALHHSDDDNHRTNFWRSAHLGDKVLSVGIQQALFELPLQAVDNKRINHAYINALTCNATLTAIGKHCRLSDYITHKSNQCMTDEMYASGMESLLAAVYLDSNNLNTVIAVIKRLWKPLLTTLENQHYSSPSPYDAHQLDTWIKNYSKLDAHPWHRRDGHRGKYTQPYWDYHCHVEIEPNGQAKWIVHLGFPLPEIRNRQTQSTHLLSAMEEAVEGAISYLVSHPEHHPEWLATNTPQTWPRMHHYQTACSSPSSKT